MICHNKEKVCGVDANKMGLVWSNPRTLFYIMPYQRKVGIYMEYTRRIPLTDDFLHYRIPDLIYGYIQHKATYNPNKG